MALGYFQVQVGWLGRRRGLFPPPRSCCDYWCHCVRISSYNCICQEGEQDKRALVNPAVTVETVMGPICLPCSLMPGWAVCHAPATPAHSWVFGLKPQVVVSLCFCPQALQCVEAQVHVLFCQKTAENGECPELPSLFAGACNTGSYSNT